MKRLFLASLTILISIFFTGCGSNLKPIPQVTYANADTEDVPSYEKIKKIEKKIKLNEDNYKPIYRQKVELRREVDKELKETYLYRKKLFILEKRKEKRRQQKLKRKKKKAIKKIRVRDNNITGNENEIIKKFF